MSTNRQKIIHGDIPVIKPNLRMSPTKSSSSSSSSISPLERSLISEDDDEVGILQIPFSDSILPVPSVEKKLVIRGPAHAGVTTVDKWQIGHRPRRLEDGDRTPCLAAHIGGNLVAYVDQDEENSNVVIYNFQTGWDLHVGIANGRRIIDMSFAHHFERYIIGWIDDCGNVKVVEIFENLNDLNTLSSVTLIDFESEIEQPSKFHFISFVPYIYETEAESKEENLEIIFAVTHNTLCDIFDLVQLAKHYHGKTLKFSDKSITSRKQVQESDSEIIRVEFSPEGGFLAVLLANGGLNFYEFSDNPDEALQLRHHIPNAKDSNDRVSNFWFLDDCSKKWSPDLLWNTFVLGKENNSTLEIWDMDSWTKSQEIHFVPNEISQGQYSFEVEKDHARRFLLLCCTLKPFVYVLHLTQKKTCHLVQSVALPFLVKAMKILNIPGKKSIGIFFDQGTELGMFSVGSTSIDLTKEPSHTTEKKVFAMPKSRNMDKALSQAEMKENYELLEEGRRSPYFIDDKETKLDTIMAQVRLRLKDEARRSPCFIHEDEEIERGKSKGVIVEYEEFPVLKKKRCLSSMPVDQKLVIEQQTTSKEDLKPSANQSPPPVHQLDSPKIGLNLATPGGEKPSSIPNKKTFSFMDDVSRGEPNAFLRSIMAKTERTNEPKDLCVKGKGAGDEENVEQQVVKGSQGVSPLIEDNIHEEVALLSAKVQLLSLKLSEVELKVWELYENSRKNSEQLQSFEDLLTGETSRALEKAVQMKKSEWIFYFFEKGCLENFPEGKLNLLADSFEILGNFEFNSTRIAEATRYLWDILIRVADEDDPDFKEYMFVKKQIVYGNIKKFLADKGSSVEKELNNSLKLILTLCKN